MIWLLAIAVVAVYFTAQMIGLAMIHSCLNDYWCHWIFGVAGLMTFTIATCAMIASLVAIFS